MVMGIHFVYYILLFHLTCWCKTKLSDWPSPLLLAFSIEQNFYSLEFWLLTVVTTRHKMLLCLGPLGAAWVGLLLHHCKVLFSDQIIYAVK